MKYKDYLNSDEWKKLRTRALKRADYKCEFCGVLATMVHHVEYLKNENSEMENINHLVACCKKCNDLSHGIRYNKPMIKNQTQKWLDTINLCIYLKINKDTMNILLKSPDFLELNKKRKKEFLEKIKKKGYKEIPDIMEELK